MKFNILIFFVIISGCAGGIQKSYWGAGTSVASDEERKGNYQIAETEYKGALWRAKNHLTEKEVSDSLYNLGAFYRRQGRLHESINYLNQSLKLEEKLSGKSSERTGRRMAELSVAYLMSNNWNEAKPLVERLKPLVNNYTGNEREVVNKLIDVYSKDQEHYATEIKKVQSLADKGDSKALFILATHYEDGRGVEQDYKKAIELYNASADKGNLDAQHYLGVIYDKGRGVKNNDTKAREWYRIASNNGHAGAQFNYAIFLELGRGGPINKEESLEWMKKSAAQGFPAAISFLKK